MTLTTESAKKEPQSAKKVGQTGWQRITLLSVLGYEAAGALSGGSLLIAAPDGRLMDMPVNIMHGVFRDFLIPGLMLFVLGILSTYAFIAVLRRTRYDWVLACLALGALAVWFWVEIAILRELHWLHFMWGLPVIAGGLVAIRMIPSRLMTMREVLLICGILSSLLHAAIIIIVAMQWKAYDSASQTISELSAIAAPTRTLWTVLYMPYAILMFAFALGVRKSAAGNRPLRIAGGLLIAYGALCFLKPFAPMHLRETLAAGGETVTDIIHIAFSMITQIIYVLSVGFVAIAFGKQFRLYSIITLAIILVFGGLTFLDGPGISKNLPTPLVGVWQRINFGVFLLWVVVLAVVLLKNKNQVSLGITMKPGKWQV